MPAPDPAGAARRLPDAPLLLSATWPVPPECPAPRPAPARTHPPGRTSDHRKWPRSVCRRQVRYRTPASDNLFSHWLLPRLQTPQLFEDFLLRQHGQVDDFPRLGDVVGQLLVAAGGGVVEGLLNAVEVFQQLGIGILEAADREGEGFTQAGDFDAAGAQLGGNAGEFVGFAADLVGKAGAGLLQQVAGGG